MFLLIDGCELLLSTEEEKKEKIKYPSSIIQLTTMQINQSKQYLIAYEAMIGTDVAFDRFTGITSN